MNLTPTKNRNPLIITQPEISRKKSYLRLEKEAQRVKKKSPQVTLIVLFGFDNFSMMTSATAAAKFRKSRQFVLFWKNRLKFQLDEIK